MGYGTRPHSWKTHELESMKNSLSPLPLSLVVLYVPIVADQHECQEFTNLYRAPLPPGQDGVRRP
jgi:hypothetical protein